MKNWISLDDEALNEPSVVCEEETLNIDDNCQF